MSLNCFQSGNFLSHFENQNTFIFFLIPSPFIFYFVIQDCISEAFHLALPTGRAAAIHTTQWSLETVRSPELGIRNLAVAKRVVSN